MSLFNVDIFGIGFKREIITAKLVDVGGVLG